MSIIKKVFPKEIFQKIQKSQKIVTLLISIFCSYISFYGSPFENHHYVDIFLLIYFFFDILLISKVDMIIHHILTIHLLWIDINTNKMFFEKITKIILVCEISTIFLSIYNLKHMFPFIKKIELFLKIFFFMTYTYYRIYLLTKLFIFNDEFEMIATSYLQSSQKRFGQYILYSLLNLYYYWYGVIIKMIFISKLKLKKE